VARPSRRLVSSDAAGSCDEGRGEFWISDPWKVGQTKRNLSAYEPNQVFLNMGELRFANISYLTTADADGDGRGVAVADVTGDLQPDLLVRQSGGGPLRVFWNRFPKTSRLEVSLRGIQSNAIGIGARVVAEFGDRKLVRQMFPANNFLVTQASVVRFGVDDAKTIDRLTVHWPSGTVQTFKAVPTGVHLRITEGKAKFETLVDAR
jgi:hypothetical protein